MLNRNRKAINIGRVDSILISLNNHVSRISVKKSVFIRNCTRKSVLQKDGDSGYIKANKLSPETDCFSDGQRLALDSL